MSDLPSMVEATISESIPLTYGIYRHFRGGYYVVQSVATVESTGEQVVIYQSLQDGRVWTRPLSEFQEPVPGYKDNPTGQRLRFEKVTNFNNQLNMIPTEELVNELLKRNDCPPELSIAQKSERVWREDFLVGRFRSYPVLTDMGQDTVTDFDVETVFNTMEEAVSRVKRVNKTSLEILKRVFIKQDFD